MSRLSPAQLAAAAGHRREGRPDIAAMTDTERTARGLMTLRQAAEHEHLASIPHTRLAERSRGMDQVGIWAVRGSDD